MEEGESTRRGREHWIGSSDPPFVRRVTGDSPVVLYCDRGTASCDTTDQPDGPVWGPDWAYVKLMHRAISKIFSPTPAPRPPHPPTPADAHGHAQIYTQRVYCTDSQCESAVRQSETV